MTPFSLVSWMRRRSRQPRLRKVISKKNQLSVKKHLKEFRFDDCSGYNVGDVITVDTFAAGDKVDVTGMTKGHGFSGVVKRWGCHKLRMTHGVDLCTASPVPWAQTPPRPVFTRIREWLVSTVMCRSRFGIRGCPH